MADPSHSVVSTRAGTEALNERLCSMLADRDWVYFEVRGRYGVPGRGTTHKYSVTISRDEIVAAVNDMLVESSNPKLSKAGQFAVEGTTGEGLTEQLRCS
jgi:hypothetical protein